jgi:hypothetical protein
LWGVEKVKRKIAWIASKTIVKKKCCAGMGFKDL